jgi:hypothetical protein
MDESRARRLEALEEEYRQLKCLVADKNMSIKDLKASADRELKKPIAEVRFQAIPHALRKEILLKIDGDAVSRRANSLPPAP